MKRFTPFSGMQVSLQDLTFWNYETADAIRLRINSDLYNPGVVNGLTIFESSSRAGTAAFTSGVAYDTSGERISPAVLRDQITYSSALLNDASIYQIALRYTELTDGTYGLDVDGASQGRHLIDSFNVIVAKQGVDSLQSADVVLAKAFSASAGASLIFDSNVRNVFSAKYAATGTNLQVPNVAVGGNLTVGGSIVVGGCITSLLGGSFLSMFVGDMGLRVTGVACFWRPINGFSDIKTSGDFYCTTAGKGTIVTSPDGTKQARLGLGNDGFPSFTTLNYTLS